MTESRYVMGVRAGVEPGASEAAPADWKRQLAGIEGVRAVAGDLPHRARFTATPEAAERVRARFSAAFHIEGVAARSPDGSG